MFDTDFLWNDRFLSFLHTDDCLLSLAPTLVTDLNGPICIATEKDCFDLQQ